MELVPLDVIRTLIVLIPSIARHKNVFNASMMMIVLVILVFVSRMLALQVVMPTKTVLILLNQNVTTLYVLNVDLTMNVMELLLDWDCVVLEFVLLVATQLLIAARLLPQFALMRCALLAESTLTVLEN